MKITFVGAGSFIFTRRFIIDILTFPALQDAELTLFDIDSERLEFINEGVKKIIEAGKYPTKVVKTLDRKKALDGSDVVIISILQGGIEVWRKDIEIPKKFGVDVSVGDSMGPSGNFRALRTIPVMLDIAADIEKYCPDAVVLNYTNPMSMISGSIQKYTKVNFVGLCHSVQGTASMLAKWINAPLSEIDYTCAGINHQAWFTRYQVNGEDAYPRIRQAILDSEGKYYQEQVRNEMFLKFGYYVTESSSHNSEYNPWFRKSQKHIEKYCHNYETEEGWHNKEKSNKYADLGWNYGIYANTLKYYEGRENKWRQSIKETINKTPDLERGNEYAAYIINALFGDGESTVFNGNIINNGIISNLPNDANVEVPIVASKTGLQPIHIGALPEHLAALNAIHCHCHNLIIQSCIEGNIDKVYYACYLDPLAGACLTLNEIKDMVDVMIKENQQYLPQFKF